MRKIVAALLIACSLVAFVPRSASADEQEDLNWQTVAQFSGFLTPEERCSAISTQSAALWGTISWLSAQSFLDPSNASTIYGPALVVAYGYAYAIGFTYWWYSCNQYGG